MGTETGGRIPPATRHTMKIVTIPTWRCCLPLAAVVCMAASSGCTSVIGSAYLREAWLDAVEHAAESTPRSQDEDTAADRDGADSRPAAGEEDMVSAADGATFDEVSPDAEASGPAAWAPATLAEAVDEADRRLAASGGLNEAARSTLLATLEGTPRQDWPIVVEEFTAALVAVHGDRGMASGPASPPTAEPTPPRPSAVAAGPAGPSPVAGTAPVAQPVAPLPPSEPTQVSEVESPRAAVQMEPAQSLFAVRNACFASRVRAWGVVDRFETAEFSAGQELIVYFELDQLSSRESADGHTTRIDTAFRLVDADGRRIHEWTFEPLEETCSGHRHDYFARYLVSVPASTPAGSLRLEIAVSDTLAGRTAHATLPLAVTAR
jgi:hypothetical protein